MLSKKARSISVYTPFEDSAMSRRNVPLERLLTRGLRNGRLERLMQRTRVQKDVRGRESIILSEQPLHLTQHIAGNQLTSDRLDHWASPQPMHEGSNILGILGIALAKTVGYSGAMARPALASLA